MKKEIFVFLRLCLCLSHSCAPEKHKHKHLKWPKVLLGDLGTRLRFAEKMAASISFDERLAEEVRKFPILYDKSSPEFKNKQKKADAWRAVAESLGLKSSKL